jgi:hypothetical protein
MTFTSDFGKPEFPTVLWRKTEACVNNEGLNVKPILIAGYPNKNTVAKSGL